MAASSGWCLEPADSPGQFGLGTSEESSVEERR